MHKPTHLLLVPIENASEETDRALLALFNASHRLYPALHFWYDVPLGADPALVFPSTRYNARLSGVEARSMMRELERIRETYTVDACAQLLQGILRTHSIAYATSGTPSVRAELQKALGTKGIPFDHLRTLSLFGDTSVTIK